MNTLTFGLSICLFGNFLFATVAYEYVRTSHHYTAEKSNVVYYPYFVQPPTRPDVAARIFQFPNDPYGTVPEGRTSNYRVSPFFVHWARHPNQAASIFEFPNYHYGGLTGRRPSNVNVSPFFVNPPRRPTTVTEIKPPNVNVSPIFVNPPRRPDVSASVSDLSNDPYDAVTERNPSNVNTARHPDLAASISEFSNDLYGAVTEGKTSNVIISPFSVYLAASLALMGAMGNTSDEMVRGLRLSGTHAEISERVHQLIEPIQNNSMLRVANKLYVMENYRIKPEFDAIAKEKFHSESESIDFGRAAESAAAINEWVEDKTNNKISNLISSEALGPDTRMVLVNAIYFKGVWQYQFNKRFTHQTPFYTSESDSVVVDMMFVKEKFRYADFSDLDAKGIELPYKDSDMSLLVILPNGRTGLAQLETQLKDIRVEALSSQMFSTTVEVSLPKFKIEFQVSMVDALKKLGMRDMFSFSANFSGLLESNEPILVSDVIHKAFIDVNEEGAEAAAATAIVTSSRMSEEYHPIFYADHPFRFILKKGNHVIFTGKYTNL